MKELSNMGASVAALMSAPKARPDRDAMPREVWIKVMPDPRGGWGGPPYPQMVPAGTEGATRYSISPVPVPEFTDEQAARRIYDRISSEAARLTVLGVKGAATRHLNMPVMEALQAIMRPQKERRAIRGHDEHFIRSMAALMDSREDWWRMSTTQALAFLMNNSNGTLDPTRARAQFEDLREQASG
jgi:hypothetical protein